MFSKFLHIFIENQDKGIVMIIYVVQVGDTITSIANRFGISEARLVRENGLPNPNHLVIGQAIVITNPQEIYIVKEEDNLSDIAKNYGIPIIQIYRYNPYLWDRDQLYPGEELVISYDTQTTITTNAYAFPYIDNNILKKSLPNLTYLSILNYKALRGGQIEPFYDDTDIIKTAKEFGVLPLMLVTSVSFRGERNAEEVYELLLNPDYQEMLIQSMIKILKEKGYYGINITITFLNKSTQQLYIDMLNRIASYLSKEGFKLFATIDPETTTDLNELLLEEENATLYNRLVDDTYIMRFYWGTQFGPPRPVGSVSNISFYVNYFKEMIEPKNISVGFPLLGYDWELPYIQGYSKANAITLDAAIELALITKTSILFDEVSKTPFYEFSVEVSGRKDEHIVWFVDARTIDEIIKLVLDDRLGGTGLWNIMNFDPQLWLIINSNFMIKKLPPEMN